MHEHEIRLHPADRLSAHLQHAMLRSKSGWLQVNVAPLANLARLHCLDLIDCKLANLLALSCLTGLRRLGMRKSRAADIASVASLSRSALPGPPSACVNLPEDATCILLESYWVWYGWPASNLLVAPRLKPRLPPCCFDNSNRTLPVLHIRAC